MRTTTCIALVLTLCLVTDASARGHRGRHHGGRHHGSCGEGCGGNYTGGGGCCTGSGCCAAPIPAPAPIPVPGPSPAPAPVPPKKMPEPGGSSEEAQEALGEVNAVRAARGLRPYVVDELLVIGAKRCAVYRAARLIEGHTGNDFVFLPAGAYARAGGCAAWHGNDWGSCCTYDGYTYAGAAWARGRDGRRFMQLFVR